MASKAKTAIVASFLKLVNSEPLDKITVTAVVEDCGISRQTFYYHFNDIEEMLRWSFETDTQQICSRLVDGKWYEAAKLYPEMLGKYDRFFRSGIHSEKMIFVYNLIYNSVETFITSYFALKNPKPVKEDNRFIIAFLSAAYAGLVLGEVQKDNSDYEALVKKIGTDFKLIQK